MTAELKWKNACIDAQYVGVIIPPREKGLKMPRGKQGTTVVDLDNADSIGEVGLQGKVVPATSTRKTGVTRKDPSEHPPCPHCGGKMHWNAAAASVNHECMWRQYCLANKMMEAPNDRLPVYTADDTMPLAEWVVARRRSRKNPLTYGKMEASGGGYATYSAKRAAEAKDIKSVAEMAADVVVSKKKKTVDEPVVLMKSDKKGKKRKKIVESPILQDEVPMKTKKLKKSGKIKAQVVEDLDDLVILDEEPKRKIKKIKGSTTAPAVAKSDKAPSLTGKKKKTRAA